MAIIDFPTTPGFLGAQFSVWVNTSERAFTGFFTGNRNTRSNAADRLGCQVTLPPVKNRIQAAAREAFIMGLRSTGDHVRFGMPHRALPLGTLSGTPTVSSSAAAGARSVTIGGAFTIYGGLLVSDFEVDTDADGLSDNWASYVLGSSTALTFAHTTDAYYGSRAQRLQATALGSGTGDRIGIWRTISVPAAAIGQTFTYSAYLKRDATSLVRAQLHISWRNSSNVEISATTDQVTPTTSYARYSTSSTVPSGTVTADVYLWWHSRSSNASPFVGDIDALQLETAPAASTFRGRATLLAGDFIGIGGNLLQSAGAAANDVGAMTVATTTPLQKAIASTAPVIWSAPTGVWELEDPGLQLDYTAPIIQGPLVLRFRQVPQ